MSNDYDRLHRLVLQGDLTAAAELFAEAQRRGSEEDRLLAAEVMLAGGHWQLTLGAHLANGSAQLRNTDRCHVGRRLVVVACSGEALSEQAALLTVATLRELFEPGHRVDPSAWPDAAATAALAAAPRPRALPSSLLERMQLAVTLCERRRTAWLRHQPAHDVPTRLAFGAIAVGSGQAAVALSGAGAVAHLTAQGTRVHAATPPAAQTFELTFVPGERIVVLSEHLASLATDALPALLAPSDALGASVACAHLIALARARGDRNRVAAALARLDAP